MKLSRTISFLFILLILSCKSKSQSKEASELAWQPSLEKALADAKDQNKLLFVECYSPTCPVCQKLEPYFKKSEITERYNTDFVSFKLDVGKAEDVKFLNDRKIFLPSFPQFLFFDGTGKLVHQSEVSPNVKSFLDAANLAKDSNKRAETYKSQFEKGNRSLGFLIDYASYCRIVRDTTDNIAAANEIFKIYPKENIGSEESWAITKKCVTDIDNGFAKYWFEHVPVAKEIETREGHPDNENNTLGGMIQNSLYSKTGKLYNTQKLQLVKSYMGKIGAAKYADGVTWEFECRAHIREGNPALALPIAEKTATKYANSGQSLVYISHLMDEIYPNNDYISHAKIWLAKAKPLLKENKDLAEYYYELARLNKKANDLAGFKTAADEGKKYAAAAQLDLSRFNAL